MYENTRARVFIHCFLVFGYPGETLALVVRILHQRFCDRSKNFAYVGLSKFWKICKKCLRELTKY